jgi:hypothetical protein
MDTVSLILIYVATTLTFQGIGFGISRAVDYQFPAFGLMTFLLLFLSAFYLAWPVAVRLFETAWGDRARTGEDEATAIARRAGTPLKHQSNLDRRA